MSHARRFRCLLIIYLPISLQLRLATRLIACLMRLMVGSPNGRGITPVSATLLGVPLSTADALRNRNRKLDISTALTKEKSWEPAYSQALVQSKIDRQRIRSTESGR